jgi:hypothetical protein
MIESSLMLLPVQKRRSTRSAITQPDNWRCLSNIKKNASITKDPIFDSAHQEPNKKAPNPDTFKELSPSQAIGVKLKRSHHQIQNLFVLTDEKRTISCIELLNLLEFDLTALCQFPHSD